MDITVEVTISQQISRFRKKSQQIYFKNGKTSIEPGKSERIEVTPIEPDFAGFDIGLGLEDFLTNGPISSLRSWTNDNRHIKRYFVLNSTPIALAMKVKYRPGLHGLNTRTQQCKYQLTPEILPFNESGKSLIGWSVKEIKS